MPDLMTPKDYARHKRENAVRVIEAERTGSPVVDAWPLELWVDFTGLCNLHCIMCSVEPLREKHRALGEVRFSVPRETFRAIVEKSLPHVNILNPTTVGEPLMLPYWDELVEVVERYGCRLDILTNGTLLRGERLRASLPHFARVSFSFDGATAETFEKIRVGADFDAVRRNLDEVARLRRELDLVDRISLEFSLTLLEQNIDELPDIVDLAAEHGVDRITANHVILYHQSLEELSPLNFPERTDAALHEARIRARGHDIGTAFPQPLSGEIDPEVPGRRVVTWPPDPTNARELLLSPTPPEWPGVEYCRSLWRESFITFDGMISTCCVPRAVPVGNIHEDDFMEVWNGPRYQAKRTGLVTGRLAGGCKSCIHLQQSGRCEYTKDAYRYEV